MGEGDRSPGMASEKRSEVVLNDTHCHLDLEQFDSDREAVLERAQSAGVERILIPSLSLKTSRAVVELVHKASGRPSLYAAAGVHPTEAGTWEDTTREELKALVTAEASKTQIAAIGEIGLDYYWNTDPPGLQKKVLQEQLALAGEAGLPVLLHMREAGDAPAGPCSTDLMSLLWEWVTTLKASKNPLAERPGVLHSFSGSLEMAQEAIELGFDIGVSGPVTFKNARQRQEIVAALPLDRLLTETDAPFLAPHPHRGQRNEPAYVGLIADKIALLHSCTSEAVAETTSANALRLFNWK